MRACRRLFCKSHTRQKESGLLKVTASQFLSFLSVGFCYWLLEVSVPFSPLSVSPFLFIYFNTQVCFHQLLAYIISSPHTKKHNMRRNTVCVGCKQTDTNISLIVMCLNAGGPRGRRRAGNSCYTCKCGRLLLLPLGDGNAYFIFLYLFFAAAEGLKMGMCVWLNLNEFMENKCLHKGTGMRQILRKNNVLSSRPNLGATAF